MRKKIHDQIFFQLFLLLAFLIPLFPRALPVVIILIIVNWLVSGSYIRSFPDIFRTQWRRNTLMLIIFYLLYLAGMTYSSNTGYGWFDLEVKLSFFIFPLLVATSDISVFTTERMRKLLFLFVAGCLTSALVLLGHAWTNETQAGVPSSFYYSTFAWYFHPGYLAMYYNFGIAILLWYLTTEFHGLSWPVRIGILVMLVFVEVLIFLLSSKAGLLVLAATQVMFLGWLLFRRVPVQEVTFIAMALVLLFFATSRMLPNASSRIEKADQMVKQEKLTNNDLSDGTAQRKEIWKISLDKIKQHWLTGVGTGDVKDTLLEAYKAKGLEPIFQKKLNAHNQYMQTFLAIGILGVAALILLLLWPALVGFISKDALLVALVANITINLMVESMLENQAGVVFTAFFLVLMFAVRNYADTAAESSEMSSGT